MEPSAELESLSNLMFESFRTTGSTLSRVGIDPLFNLTMWDEWSQLLFTYLLRDKSSLPVVEKEGLGPSPEKVFRMPMPNEIAGGTSESQTN